MSLGSRVRAGTITASTRRTQTNMWRTSFASVLVVPVFRYLTHQAQMHGDQYKRCFKKPCPYYDKLDELYDGAKNRATGEHTLLLGKKKKKTSTKASRKSEAAAPKASKTTTTANKENLNIDPSLLDAHDAPSTPRRATVERAEDDGMMASDDELLVVRLLCCTS